MTCTQRKAWGPVQRCSLENSRGNYRMCLYAESKWQISKNQNKTGDKLTFFLSMINVMNQITLQNEPICIIN